MVKVKDVLDYLNSTDDYKKEGEELYNKIIKKNQMEQKK